MISHKIDSQRASPLVPSVKFPAKPQKITLAKSNYQQAHFKRLTFFCGNPLEVAPLERHFSSLPLNSRLGASYSRVQLAIKQR